MLLIFNLLIEEIQHDECISNRINSHAEQLDTTGSKLHSK